jgi:hypothetical protein
MSLREEFLQEIKLLRGQPVALSAGLEGELDMLDALKLFAAWNTHLLDMVMRLAVEVDRLNGIDVPPEYESLDPAD